MAFGGLTVTDDEYVYVRGFLDFFIAACHPFVTRTLSFPSVSQVTQWHPLHRSKPLSPIRTAPHEHGTHLPVFGCGVPSVHPSVAGSGSDLSSKCGVIHCVRDVTSGDCSFALLSGTPVLYESATSG